jgi:cell division septum initiation protein DivIVA
MGLEPNEIDLEGLPRTIGGGLKKEPVEELLRRVQWEYSQLYYEHKRLKDSLEDRPPAADRPGDLEKRTGDLQKRISAATGSAVEVQPVEVQNGAKVEVVRHTDQPPRERDELARVVLSSALQASREMRESARRECELILRKARARVVALERDFERGAAARVAVLADLDATVHEIREQMRHALETFEPELAAPENGAVHELFPAVGSQSRPAPFAQTER